MPTGHKTVSATPSQTLLAVALELLAVGGFTLIAGISDKFGSVVVTFMVGLWLMYIIFDSDVITRIGNALNRGTKAAAS